MTTVQQKATKLSLSCPVDALLEASSKLLVVVPTKSPKPVLSNILFSVKDGILELAGTDFVAGIYYSIPAASITTEGQGLLNGARLSEILKEFRGTEATLLFNQRGGCKFKARGGKLKVVGDDVRDYPKIPRFDSKKGFEISAVEVVDMIKKTIFAMAPEESRLTTHGVLFELKEGRFRLVATDNKRMSITERRVDTDLPDFSASVPDSFLKAVLKVTTKDLSNQKATIGIHGRRVFFRLPSTTVYTVILQGDYPPYQEALDIKLKYHVDCSVKEFLSTLRRAMLVNRALSAFNFQTGELILKSSSAAVGAGNAEMAVDLELPEGVEKIRVGLNTAFIKECLEVTTSKRCRFYFEGERNAVILKELKEGEKAAESDEFVYAAMPALLPKEV